MAARGIDLMADREQALPLAAVHEVQPLTEADPLGRRDVVAAVLARTRNTHQKPPHR